LSPASTAIPNNVSSRAAAARSPSPPRPGIPLPATVAIVPGPGAGAGGAGGNSTPSTGPPATATVTERPRAERAYCPSGRITVKEPSGKVRAVIVRPLLAVTWTTASAIGWPVSAFTVPLTSWP
jgi:hypothetical protein